MAGSQSRSPLALVTGATGALGPRVVEALHGAGYTVRTLSLDARDPGLLPASIETRLGDITDEAAVRAAMAGVDVVVHLAALLHIVNPSPELRPKYERVNIGGTQIVVEAALAAGVKRLVFFSTIAVYGYGSGRFLDEDTPAQPDTFYAQTKLAAEEIVLAARRADGEPLGAVLRPAAVYGSRLKGNYERLLQALARGRFIPIGPGTNRRTLVYDRDVANAVLLAAQHPSAAGRVFNVTDGEPHMLREIIAVMCQALGRRPPHVALPVGPIRLAASVIERTARLARVKSPIVQATVDKYTEDVAVDGSRIRRELGFVSQYDLVAGWRETVAELRHSGQL